MWLVAAVAAWLAAVGATCALLNVAKGADAAAAAGGGERRPRGRPEEDATGRVKPRISAIAVGVRAPGHARRTSAIAPGELDPRWLRPPPASERSSPGHSYALYVGDAMVARLCWRAEPGEPAGWYLWQRRDGWRRLAVDPELDAGQGLVTRRPGWQQAADLAASVSTVLALDAAANFLHGPPASPPHPLRGGCYEVHAAGLAFEVAAIAFPEAVTARAGDTMVLTGHFDDRGLTVLTRRIAILGGHVLAIFRAQEPHTPRASS